MKRWIIITIILLLSSTVYSQLSGTYNFSISKNCDCFLDLLDNGKYQLELVFVDKDYSVSISNGKYKLINKKLFLTDSYNNYLLKLELRNNSLSKSKSLFVTKGFVWMKNALFEKNIDTYIDVTNKSTTTCTIQSDRIKNSNLKIGVHTLYYGQYKFNQFGWCYSLELLKPNRYIYSLDNLILSKGTFLRNKNELALYDISLDYTVYFFINKKGLEEKFIPSDNNFQFIFNRR